MGIEVENALSKRLIIGDHNILQALLAVVDELLCDLRRALCRAGTATVELAFQAELKEGRQRRHGHFAAAFQSGGKAIADALFRPLLRLKEHKLRGDDRVVEFLDRPLVEEHRHIG